MNNHVMIDLETLSLDINCVILSIGACYFDIDSGQIGDKFYNEIDIQSQIDQGRTVSESTIVWWMGQSEEAKSVFKLGHKTSLHQSIYQLRDFISEDAYVWSHGASFDVPIIEALMSGHFKYYNVRDTRTIYWLANFVVQARCGTAHNALDDALFQAKCVCDAYKILKQK